MAHIAKYVLLLLVSSLVFGATIHSLQAAPTIEPLPPKVIDVSPLPGALLTPHDALTFTFDQPMDRQAVEAAFNISPRLDGLLNWTNSQTLTFSPQRWPLATIYTVTIGFGARASNSVPLDSSYTLTVKTEQLLAVGTVSPEPGATLVNTAAQIIISFNRPVVPLTPTGSQTSLPLVGFTPNIVGDGKWINTSLYSFTPAQPLIGGITYTATIASGLSASDDSMLDAPYRWSFQTALPDVLTISPNDERGGWQSIDTPITVTFSQPVNTLALESSFSLQANGSQVIGTFTWSANDTTMTFQPAAWLKQDTLYIVAIDSRYVREARSAQLKTMPLPKVEAFNWPKWPGKSSGTLQFLTAMNGATLQDRFSITPAAGDVQVIFDPKNPFALNISLDTQLGVTYTVTFKHGAQDVFGSTIATDFSTTFTVTPPVLPPLKDNIYPVINSDLMITDADQQSISFSVQVGGTPTVDFELYHVTPADLGDTTFSNATVPYYYSHLNDTHYSWMTTNRLIRAWTQSFAPDNKSNIQTSNSYYTRSLALGSLLPGMYWITMKRRGALTYDINGGQMKPEMYQFPLAVSTAAITVKRAPHETFVWLTDLHTAQPFPNAMVTLYNRGKVIANGETDADGVFRAPIDLPVNLAYAEGYRIDPAEELVIIAEAPGQYSAWYSQSSISSSVRASYMYTDRSLYRPGETVHFRGILRQQSGATYIIPSQSTVHIVAAPGVFFTGYDARFSPTSPVLVINRPEVALFETNVPLSPFGSFSGDLKLPDNTALGSVYIRTDDGLTGITIQVEDFRPSDYQVMLDPVQSTIIQGDPLQAFVKSVYYFGGKLANSQVQWHTQANPIFFNYTGPGRYDFVDSSDTAATNPLLDSTKPLEQGVSQTDNNGHLTIRAVQTQMSTNTPVQITLEATVIDPTGQAVSARTTIVAHPAAIYVGLASDDYAVQDGQPFTLNVITVNPASSPAPGQIVHLTFSEFCPALNGYSICPLSETQINTGLDGTGRYKFIPPHAGSYVIHAETSDAAGRVSRSALSFWVTGEQPTASGTSMAQDQHHVSVQISATKTTYQPGDIAHLLITIKNTNDADLLITTENTDILTYTVPHSDGNSFIYDVPISDADAPAVNVAVTIVQGISAAFPFGDIQTSHVKLVVAPTQHRLIVRVTPSTTQAKPRDAVTLNVSVTDRNGKPVVAEVGISIVDKAALALAEPNSGTLEDAFYDSSEPYYVDTSSNIYALIESLTEPVEGGMLGGGGEGLLGNSPSGTLQVRTNFKYTALWAPAVVTDTNGHASVTVVLPDNLTTWQIDARAVSVATDVGQSSAEFVSTLPLLIRPAVPRFFVVGDKVELATEIENNTGSDQSVAVTLDAKGVILNAPKTQTVQIVDGSQARVSWSVTVLDASGADLTFSAIAAHGSVDAVKPASPTSPEDTIPIYHYIVPDTVATTGVLRAGESRIESVSVPPRLNTGQGNLTIQIAPSLAVVTVNSLVTAQDNLSLSVEGIVSHFWPYLITSTALHELALDTPELLSKRKVLVQSSLGQLLAAQNTDGGWGWWPNEPSNSLATAYVVLGLHAAVTAGYTVDQRVEQRAAGYLQIQLVTPTITTPIPVLNAQAFTLYVLAQIDYISPADLAAALDYRLKLSYAARAYLLLAYEHRDPQDSAVAQLISDLESRAILTATGVHWEEDQIDWKNWGSDTRTTALVLDALLKTRPMDLLLPDAVHWLVNARQGDQWATSQETTWSLIALTDWLAVSGEAHDNYAYTLSLNNVALVSATATPESGRVSQTLHVPLTTLFTDRPNRLTLVRGASGGLLYYTARLNAQLPASTAKAVSHGLTLSREYFPVDRTSISITSGHVGDLITVRLTLTVPDDMHFVTIEDPLPSGVEAVDSSLLTATNQSQLPQLVRQSSDPAWWWGWQSFNRSELRNDQTDLYADYLPRGTYIYSYQIRATIPGLFQVRPAHAYAVYAPDVFGRTGGVLFTVLGTPVSNSTQSK